MSNLLLGNLRWSSMSRQLGGNELMISNPHILIWLNGFVGISTTIRWLKSKCFNRMNKDSTLSIKEYYWLGCINKGASRLVIKSEPLAHTNFRACLINTPTYFVYF